MRIKPMVHKCECGRRRSRWSNECHHCFEVKMETTYKTNDLILASNKCPDCGSSLRRNHALEGWYQCMRYGHPDFRPNVAPEVPHCGFQMFVRPARTA